MAKWCVTKEMKGWTLYYHYTHYNLLAHEEDFLRNIEWYVAWEVEIMSEYSKWIERWYGLKDGTVVWIGPQRFRRSKAFGTFCHEYDMNTGIQKLIEVFKDDAPHPIMIYVAGNVPREVIPRLQQELGEERGWRILEVHLPRQLP